ncbi:alpha-(1,3)-fucosyltransferase C-like [Physella acuta]|uniref:alpha-(1,3)-fucosyltransferase C-like n=1 Tax=Physella acuta TaxID=109671 RepID=UPI0027DE9FD4|nr:alpha-(1,3)-fucosyltransferase C-like [Physella acuta]
MVMGVRLQDQHKPPVRWPGQLYVMFAHESPVHYQKSSLQKASSPWRYAFNMTHTYTQDSDVFWPVNQLRFEYTPHLQKPNYSEIFKNKNRTAVWLVSHCSTQSLREKYVKEMQKYIDVDIFGACAKRRVCPDINDTGCLDKVFNTYKFYLGFENSVCVDYVTEKFFNAFTPGRHVVPVVMGGADYDRLLPNGSFINTGWFQTARDLAMYLKVVGQDEATYTRYLKVKDMYRPTGSQGTLCLMCDALFGDIKPKVYDMYAWLTGQCRAPKKFV